LDGLSKELDVPNHRDASGQGGLDQRLGHRHPGTHHQAVGRGEHLGLEVAGEDRHVRQLGRQLD
jgi:hypothetical protein